MNKKAACYYTIGRVVSEPTAHVTKGSFYLTVYVELFGGMRVSALAGKQEISKGMHVGVRITPKAKGETTYNVFALNDEACSMIKGAAAYIGVDDGGELPF
ncbi:MAG: hypothetical protein IJ422_05790 [Oscillospiraceae bacterium]|nr:hypothetical protein [Oscillospiraceae bacterium]